ncbi:DUF4124 domain-containing protein [Rhodanobacter umsongensis]|uniref:DUF4124 domain-containing protein n=1 Tax=Rhodanobacter umsongensis TaxID=633153 RepID=A0ABW0JI29_9GAMM
MNILPLRSCLFLVAVLLLALAPAAAAQNIYKCSKGGRIEYTDRPCPGAKGELIHQADDSEVIDQYLRLGQDALARKYAESHHLQALYKQRVAAYQQKMAQEDERKAEADAAANLRDEQARQQAQEQAAADDAANRERLREENEALRQQNAQYRDQLTEPAYYPPPAYWGVTPPYSGGRHDHHDGDHDHGHDHDHGDRPSKEPVFHPCQQLAGGRVKC